MTLPISLIECRSVVGNYLFTHEFRQINNRIEGLIKKHDTVCGSKGMERRFGFIFDGVAYRIQTPPQFFTALYGLDPSLDPEMNQIVNTRKIIEREKKKIEQVLVKLLNPCKTLQDLRDALPDSVVLAFKELNLPELQRERETAFTLQESPRDLRAFEKLVPRIDYYSGTRMLY